MSDETMKTEATAEEVKVEKKKNRGGRNLFVLGAIAVLIAFITTSISLLIYERSGDIYLDRSRPGYLPDEEEAEKEENDPEGEYNFSQTGEITEEVLDEYLEKMQVEIEAIDGYKDPFSEGALSDERLGI
ncbi:MAG: hypothetical protein Q4B65_00225 [Candidatus Saccharibacteria bacterium]|nr:hypothetical protein [Candidatus Saccharibacteria bacterium]